MLEICNLRKVYEDGTLAVDDLNLTVKAGEIFILLGANGAGKTSTIMLILGFTEPTAGEVRINDINVQKQPLEAKKHVAYVSENIILYGNFTARQNLDFFTRLSGRKDVTEDEYRAVFKRVGLAEKQDWGAHGRLELLFEVEGKRDAIPVSTLSWMGQGIQPVLPEGIKARPDEFRTIDRGLTRNPLLGLLPTPDFIYIVNVVLSLLAILFMFDAVCGEKETGTLRLTLANAVPRSVVLLGKWIGGFAALILPFVLTVIAGVAVVLVQPKIEIGEVQWLKFIGVCGLALFYTAAVYSLAIWVSCLTARPSTSIMVLITIWLLAVLTIPNLSPYVAQTVRPTRNPVELETLRMATNREIWKREIDDKAEAINGKLGFKTANWWEEVDWNKLEDWRRAIQRFTAEAECSQNANLGRMAACRKIDEDFERDLDNQIRLSRWISRISPFSCFAMSATELTDTGLLNKRRFIRQVRDFQEVLTRYTMAEWIKYEEVLLKEGGPNVRNPDWTQMRSRVPVFTYAPPAGTEYLHMILLDAGILVAMTLVFFMLSFTAFIRYDVR